MEQARFQRRDEIDQIKKARQARREDWELGPLAPKRDVGNQKETWGTINSLRSKGPVLAKKERWEQRLFVGGKHPTIVVNDRVAIMEGRDKGKIGTIVEMDFSRGECKVEGLNMVCLHQIPTPKLRTGTDGSLLGRYQSPRMDVSKRTRTRQTQNSFRRATHPLLLDPSRCSPQKC